MEQEGLEPSGPLVSKSRSRYLPAPWKCERRPHEGGVFYAFSFVGLPFRGLRRRMRDKSHARAVGMWIKVRRALCILSDGFDR